MRIFCVGRNEFILDFLLFITSKNNPLDGDGNSMGKRYLYIGNEGINWHTLFGKLFENLKFKYGHNL